MPIQGVLVDETRNGKFEQAVIIGKHRNGPVGSIELTFLNRYPKFASIAAESAATGAAAAYGG